MQSWQSFKARFSLQAAQGAGRWLRQNLFSTWYSALLTFGCTWVLAVTLQGLGTWVFTQAQWEVVTVNLRLIFVGRYPVEQLWRLWLILMLLASVPAFCWGAIQGWGAKPSLSVAGVGLSITAIIALSHQSLGSILWLGLTTGTAVGSGWVGQWCQHQPRWKLLKPWLPLGWFFTFLIILWLISGGFGLVVVGTTFWNGLLLTLLVAVVSIVLSFPGGVLLALGRQSPLPIIKAVSTLYIELMRGLPLIGILFMAQVMLPLLLPPQLSVDQLVRAIVGLTLFSAAYLAETVRGGLQSIPSGQWEASRALGLSVPLTLGFIVLPQALRAVVPAIVGQFISLFKDTALLSIVGLVELTGIARSITSQPEYLGHYAEVYGVLGLIYWLFCYGMSVASRRLELPSGLSNDR